MGEDFISRKSYKTYKYTVKSPKFMPSFRFPGRTGPRVITLITSHLFQLLLQFRRLQNNNIIIYINDQFVDT